MQKTGESYTAARVHVLNAKPETKAAPAPAARKVKEPKPDYAALAGMSDASVKKATGCDWERWVAALDYAGAATMTHREIAEYVHTKFKTPDWWTQMVTVGYERIRGLRAIGQRRGGSYEASKSKTVPVPLSSLYEVFSNARLRARWLPGTKLAVRRATPEKSMSIAWNDGTAVDVGFFAKGEAKSLVAISHLKLASKADADRMKAFWGERLERLAELVKTRSR
jgi:hypothetical protein